MNTKKWTMSAIVLMVAGCLACGGAFADRHHRRFEPGRAFRAIPGPGQMMGRHSGHDAVAHAIRDVGMANAFVNLAGIAVSATRPPVYCAQPCGHYVRERIVVRPAHYETYQVWIPEVYDPYTGEKAGGYYETRTQWIPETYQYRDVWIPER